MEINLEKIIEEVNHESPYNQGIFIEPFGIPHQVKERVIYMRYETGGSQGGSCWGDESEHYTVSDIPPFKSLDLFLTKICPELPYLKYKSIEENIKHSVDTEWEYYGNSTDWGVKFVPLSKVLEIINK